MNCLSMFVTPFLFACLPSPVRCCLLLSLGESKLDIALSSVVGSLPPGEMYRRIRLSLGYPCASDFPRSICRYVMPVVVMACLIHTMLLCQYHANHESSSSQRCTPLPLPHTDVKECWRQFTCRWDGQQCPLLTYISVAIFNDLIKWIFFIVSLIL